MSDIFFVTILVLIALFAIMVIFSNKNTENKYVGPFPRTVKARKAYGFEIVDAKIIGTRKRWFITKYLVEYRHHSTLFVGTYSEIRYIRHSQIVKN